MSFFTLRPYQLAAVEGVRKCYREGKRAPIVVAPTGAGKTIISCHIIEQAQLRPERQVTLFLAHRKELIDQTWKKLKKSGIVGGVIRAGDWRTDYSKPVQVASVQTLCQRLDHPHNLRSLPVNLIIIDECHHARATSYRKILDAYPNAKVIGLTATPYRADGKGLGGKDGIFDSFVEVATLEQLIEMGFLVPPLLYAAEGPDLSGVKMTAGDYNEKELAERVDTKVLVGDIVRQWFLHAKDRKTLMFGVNREHAKHVRDLFIAAGVKADYVDGDTPTCERDGVFERFASGEITVLCNVGIATEGYDCPSCSCVILARPTKSRCMWRQMVGRVLRPDDGKVNCIILDHAGCDEEHGWLLDPDEVSLENVKWKPRKREAVEESAARCPNKECGAIFPWKSAAKDLTGALICPMCQTLLKRPAASIVQTDDKVELRLVDHAARRREFYRKTASEGYAKGWEPITVNLKFKERFRSWPTDADREGAPVRTGWANKVRVWIDAEGKELPPVKRHPRHVENLEQLRTAKAAAKAGAA